MALGEAVKFHLCEVEQFYLRGYALEAMRGTIICEAVSSRLAEAIAPEDAIILLNDLIRSSNLGDLHDWVATT